MCVRAYCFLFLCLVIVFVFGFSDFIGCFVFALFVWYVCVCVLCLGVVGLCCSVFVPLHLSCCLLLFSCLRMLVDTIVVFV